MFKYLFWLVINLKFWSGKYVLVFIQHLNYIKTKVTFSICIINMKTSHKKVLSTIKNSNSFLKYTFTAKCKPSSYYRKNIVKNFSLNICILVHYTYNWCFMSLISYYDFKICNVYPRTCNVELRVRSVHNNGWGR